MAALSTSEAKIEKINETTKEFGEKVAERDGKSLHQRLAAQAYNIK